MSEEELEDFHRLHRRTYAGVHKYNIKLPPNTLTNADGTPYQAGYDEEAFELLENELHVLYDMLHERIKQAEKDLPESHSSHAFRMTLLNKLTKAIIWSRNGSKVTILKDTSSQ